MINEHENPDVEIKNEEIRDIQIQGIEKNGIITASGQGLRLQCLSVIGQIEGHYLLGSANKTTKYEHVIPMLIAIELDDNIDGLIIVLNTVGGDVEAGLAIAEMIASMTKPTVSLVLGGGHSIGVPLAVAAKHSFIVPTATMTLHPVRINGTVIGAPQTYCYFDKMQERILSFIQAHSSADPAAVRTLMMRTDEMATDIGTIIDGTEAVRLGLINSIGGLSDVIATFRGRWGAGMRRGAAPDPASL